jgi:hypothetical protein
VRFRPVHPSAIRTPEFFERVHPLWFRYFMIDATCAFHGEPFFGQDRLEVLLWWLRQHGLAER